jgi:signal transduction histidine kinase
VTAFVIIASIQADPAPGGHGRALAVTTALVAYGLSSIALGRLRNLGTAGQVPLHGIVILSACSLVGLQSNGPGFLGVFPPVISGALRLPTRWSAALVAVALAALVIGWRVDGDRPVVGIVLNATGVVAFYAVATFARRLRESNERAHALLLELQETRAAQAEAAVLAERQRLAREMHDVLAHSLSGLVINLESAKLLAARDGAGADVGEAIERARRLAKTGLDEARRAIGTLRDEELPGPERLGALTAQFEADTGIACSLSVTGPAREMPPNGRLTLYRVAQEALTNIRKHSSPMRVEVRLAYEPSGTRLTVEDFESPKAPATDTGSGTGYGLTGMRERAELLGGTLQAGATEQGFRVVLEVPA